MLTIRRRGKNFHVRGTVRIGRETRVIKEHSCGTWREGDILLLDDIAVAHGRNPFEAWRDVRVALFD